MALMPYFHCNRSLHQARLEAERKKQFHHSRLHHFLAQLNVVESSSESDEEHPHHHSTIDKKPTRRYCVRIVFPGVLFTTGMILLLVFIANLINVLPREQGQCSVTGFQKGRACGDCKFEIKVDGWEKMGFFHVDFEPDGQAKGDAFRDCPVTSNCCDYQVHVDELGVPEFCDSKPWDCHYIVANGDTPTSIRDGNLEGEYNVFLYLSIVFLLLLFPLSYFHAWQLDKRYRDDLEAHFERAKGAGLAAREMEEQLRIQSATQKEDYMMARKSNAKTSY